MTAIPPPGRLLTPAQAAKFLGMPLDELAALTTMGKGPRLTEDGYGYRLEDVINYQLLRKDDQGKWGN